uniref:Potassium channel subfamily K member 18 isoform X2 n=1 Tax=Phascolarctos cinereus TaxID=38626 RepID=A0A6P5KFY6_PHACI|nr:potassium channel subfamily K member 18 isoform X2 [Phascolarctos cinereus]
MVPKEEQDAAEQSSYFPSPDKDTLQVPDAKECATRKFPYFPSTEKESLHLSRLPGFADETTSSKRNFCCRAFGNIFPHLFFISVMVIYAFLGAVLFRVIESGTNDSNVEFEAFLNELWTFCERNKAGSEKERKTSFMTVTKKMIQDEVKHDWLISSKDWSFMESLFFCCTVFTTVGYGNIYPRTRLGKIVCVLYALFGIPLMFLVMTTVGDILAWILSTIYSTES